MLSNTKDDATLRPEYAALLQILNENPADARAHFELGILALQFSDLALAVRCFSTVTQLAPAVEAGFFNLGNTFFAMDNFQAAVEAFETAFKLDPAWGTLNNIGNSLAAGGNIQKSIDVFRQALELADRQSADAVCILGNLGTAYSQVGDWQAANDCFREAFRVSVPTTEVFNRYLRGCLWSGDVDAGIKALKSPEQLAILDQESRCLAAQLHQRVHGFSKAMLNLLEALEKYPEDPAILSQIAVLNFARGRRTESLFCFERVRSKAADSAQLHSHWLRLLNHRPEIGAAEIYRESVAMANRHLRPGPARTLPANGPANDGNTPSRPMPSRPVRIGFLYNDFQAEVNVFDFWLKPLLQHADRSRCEFFLYCDHIASTLPDSVLKDASIKDVDTDVKTAHLSDADLVNRIREDQIDVLFDLIGHGLHNRLEVFAERAANIQIAWAGYLATTGVEQMDYVLADQTVLPVELSAHFSESPIWLPKTYMAYKPPNLDIQMPPAPFIQRGWITFGSGTSPGKISDEVIDVWSKILLETAGSKLRLVHTAFLDSGVQKDFQSWFEHRGIEAQRLIFGYPAEDFPGLSRYALLDIALDPFPVNDPLVALESTWMGAPVVFLRSDRMAGRAVASIFSPLELPFTDANSTEEYVRHAVQLASDLPALRRTRETLRSRLIESTVCDTPAFALAFQSAILELRSRPGAP